MANLETTRNIEVRQELFELSKDRLEHFAYRAINALGMTPDQFVVVCIHVDDPNWTDLANYLAPNEDWQKFRDRGQKPVARGSVRSDIVELFKEIVPAIAPSLDMELPASSARAIVCDAGGASVFLIEPREHLLN